MMGVGVRRVVPLTLGWVDVPKSVSVDGASGEPLLAALAGAGLDLADIRAVAADGGYRLVAGHDPDLWPALTAELAAS